MLCLGFKDPRVRANLPLGGSQSPCQVSAQSVEGQFQEKEPLEKFQPG